MQTPTTGMTLGQFLGHQTRAGSGGQYLRGWRNRTPPAIDTFLHRKAPIIALWQHNLPRIYERGEGRDATRVVYGGRWNCLEHEDTLRRQYRRDDNDDRQSPPVICPICKLIEAARKLYIDGVLKFCEPLFRWQGDDPKDVRTVTLGGLAHMYDSESMDVDEEKAVRAAGISLKNAWQENGYAKCYYCFIVVDAAEPDLGVQIAIETTALGDAVKAVIRDQMTAQGDRDGNPLLNPYAIRWEHRPNAASFGEKYNALAMPRVKCTPAIQQLIDSDAPDLDHITRPANVTTLRAELEQRCVSDRIRAAFDWDELFGAAERAGYGNSDSTSGPQPGDDADEPERASATSAQAAEAEPPAAKKKTRKKKAKPKAKPQIACDTCIKLMDEDASVCPHCGAEYEFDEEDGVNWVDGEQPPPAKATNKPAEKGKLPF